MVKQKVLITGAGGKLGKKLGIYLSRKYEVVPWTRIDGDIGITKKFKKVDYVVHLASCMNGDDKYQCNNTNVEGMKNLISYYDDKRLRKFIFVSSMAVFLNDGKYNHNSNSWYIRTKIAAEKLLEKSNINWTIIYPTAIIDFNDKKVGLVQKLTGGFPGSLMSKIGSCDRVVSYVEISKCMKDIENSLRSEKQKRLSYSKFLTVSDFENEMLHKFGGYRLFFRIPVWVLKLLSLFIRLPCALADFRDGYYCSQALNDKMFYVSKETSTIESSK